jgi:AraC-like DNA-binding protein
VLLAMTDKSVSDITQEMGFCDQSYFGTVFRKLVGMTPAAYRARSRADGAKCQGNHGAAPLGLVTRAPVARGVLSRQRGPAPIAAESPR